MAKIVLGMGSSHGPMLSTPPEQWNQRVAADRMNKEHYFKGRRYTFDELIELRADENLQAEITLDKWKARHAACRKAIDVLEAVFAEVNPDVVVIVGNDQKEVFNEKNFPAFCVFRGATVENIPLTSQQLEKLPPGVAVATPGHITPERTSYRCLPELADHIVASLTAGEFDVAVSSELPEGPRGRGIPHAFGFLYRQIMGDRVPPHVPIFVNTFFPPNQPTAKRCFDFGRALARAVQSWASDKTVALMASGGLSHFVIDEELDQAVLQAMRDGDIKRLTAVPESMFQAGTSEIKNWIPVAGAMVELGMQMNLVDYVPCYRSEAGTGNAMAFIYWQS